MKKRMNLNKKGISLTILVITLIIMSILAGIITVKLTDIKIMGNANNNVGKINLNQVKSLATIAWTEAYVSENITTSEQYEEHIKKELIEAGISVNEFEIDADKNGVKITKKQEEQDPEEPSISLDTTKPTVEIVLNNTVVQQGGTVICALSFADDTKLSIIDVAVDDIVLNGFTATKEIAGEGYMRVLTLSNIHGDGGKKTITIKKDVAIDSSNNKSVAITSEEFQLLARDIILADLITGAEMYGTKVNYEANGVTDWKVFYKQTVGTEEYVYLIASEKLAYSAYYDGDGDLTELGTKLKNSGATIKKVTAGTKTVGEIYWTSTPSGIAVAETVKDKWLAKWSDYTSNPNVKCISYFLDETIWKDFANTEDYLDDKGNSYVKGAIGTPTAEMFVASWNAIREATGDTTKYDKKLKLEPKETIGYYINDITSETTSSNTTTQSISTSDTLYIWSTVSNSSVWLASPSVGSTNFLMNAYYSGYVDFYAFNSSEGGMRPVVCLSADIPAQMVGGNIEI